MFPKIRLPGFFIMFIIKGEGGRGKGRYIYDGSLRGEMKYMDGWMALGGAFFFLRDYIRRPSSLCALRAHFINHSARARAAWKIKSQNWDGWSFCSFHLKELSRAKMKIYSF